MTMRNFIRENREEIDRCVHSIPGMEDYRLNDKDRRDWILNDESLYRWARSEGVKI
jgi:hypothetical protein